MTGLAAKVLLAPCLIALVTLAARRWGPAVAGWLVGFPITSGPVSYFLAREQGLDFAAAAATGTLLGLVSFGSCCLAYALAARRLSWGPSAAAGVLAFAASTLVFEGVRPGVPWAFLLASAWLAAATAAIPASAPPRRTGLSPRWDLPLRMAVATAVVLALTAGAALLGPSVTGLVSPFPILVLILTVFAHRGEGRGAATAILRGAVIGSFAFAVFFLVVAGLLLSLGVGPTYLLASGAAVAASGAALRLARRPGRAPQPRHPPDRP